MARLSSSPQAKETTSSNKTKESQKDDVEAVEKKSPAVSSSSLSYSEAEIRYVLQGCEADIRTDGRTRNDRRPYMIQGGSSAEGAVLALSNGSSRVSLPDGSTNVLCSVRAEIVRPSASRPREGVVDVAVERLSSPREARARRRAEETELASLLSKLLLSNCLTLDQLCILESKYVWRLAVDIFICCCDGSLVDVCAMAIRCALFHTKIPSVTHVSQHVTSDMATATTVAAAMQQQQQRPGDDLWMESDVQLAISLPGVQLCPVLVTVLVVPKLEEATSRKSKTGDDDFLFLLDGRWEEEVCSSCRITFAIAPKTGEVCGVSKHGSATPEKQSSFLSSCLPWTVLNTVTGMAVESVVGQTWWQLDDRTKDEEAESTGMKTSALFSSPFEFR